MKVDIRAVKQIQDTVLNVSPERLIVVVLEEEDRTTASGIVLKKDLLQKQLPTTGYVARISANPDHQWREGDYVAFNAGGAGVVSIDGNEYHICHYKDVLFSFKEDLVKED